MGKTIAEWARLAHENARAHGFHDGFLSEREAAAALVANLHGEVSELWEAYRAGRLLEPCDKAEQMAKFGPVLSCAAEELADIVIRAFDTAEALGIDIERAIEIKHAYNVQRPHKHGGKLA